MSRPDSDHPRHELAALLNVFVGGVVGGLANIGGRAWLNGNTYIAGVAGIGALVFVALVILTQVSDWAYWRGEKPEILDPKRRAKIPWFRKYSLAIGFGVGLVLPYILIPELFAGQP